LSSAHLESFKNKFSFVADTMQQKIKKEAICNDSHPVNFSKNLTTNIKTFYFVYLNNTLFYSCN